jgi:hypothetical protein
MYIYEYMTTQIFRSILGLYEGGGAGERLYFIHESIL